MNRWYCRVCWQPIATRTLAHYTGTMLLRCPEHPKAGRAGPETRREHYRRRFQEIMSAVDAAK